MRALAVLSMHTSPLAQPGSGDGGGMNVYVRELCASLARSGVRCEVFTRADDPARPATVPVEPGVTVHHVAAGPVRAVPKEQLPALVAPWTEAVAARLAALAVDGRGVDAVHAHYWLSGVAGHALKHELDVPLVSTFHTLDRVKAEHSAEELDAAEPARRALAEAEVIGCSDVVLASCSVEADQIADLYDADRNRIAIVAPGYDHAFFGPGDRAQARRAAGFPADDPVVIFVGRIQPLKGLHVAVQALADVVRRPGLERATLVAVGGPSGPHGHEELAAVQATVAAAGIADRVRLLAPQPHELLATHLRAADVAVVPSRSESFGLVALEAAACGLPVVAAAVGGLTTLVDHGRTGYLVEGRDPARYAEHLAALLSDRSGLAARLGAAAATRASTYTWAAAADRLRAAVAEVERRPVLACR
ncbi:MAG TPA: glycosyltransferase [Acidimicrobiales bacterium]|nr:glycosyltransferase [Acidimicrobiales bacterium]